MSQEREEERCESCGDEVEMRWSEEAESHPSMQAARVECKFTIGNFGGAVLEQTRQPPDWPNLATLCLQGSFARINLQAPNHVCDIVHSNFVVMDDLQGSSNEVFLQ